MRAESIPILRLEIQNLKHTICNAIGIEGSELEKVIEESIAEQAMKIIPEVERLVKESLEDVIRERVRAYWDFGKGREVIDKAIDKAIKIGK